MPRSRVRRTAVALAFGVVALLGAATAASATDPASGAPAAAGDTSTTVAPAPTAPTSTVAAQASDTPEQSSAPTTSLTPVTTEAATTPTTDAPSDDDATDPPPPAQTVAPTPDLCDPDYVVVCPNSAEALAVPAVDGAPLTGTPVMYGISASVREGHAKHHVLKIPVYLSDAAPNGATVRWQTSRHEGTAKPGVDYVAASGTLTFPSHGNGARLQYIKIDVLPLGGTITNSEFHTVRIVLSHPVGARFPGLTGQGKPRASLVVTGIILDFRTPYGPPFN